MDVLVRNNVHVSGSPGSPVMVFAHGFGCDQQMWRRVAPRFTDTHRVVVFDRVGAGGSDVTAWDIDRYSHLRAYAEDLVEVVEALDVVVVCTDGVGEARAAGDTEFSGDQRVVGIRTTHRESADDLTRALVAEVLAFSSGLPRDDVAVVAVGVRS